GGQDSKVIWVEANGRVRDFAMNDRCAAGTGRFLEMVATLLGADMPRLSEMSQRSVKPALISSTCVVFAETEIIGLLASGVAVEDIAAGVHRAIASRVSAMTIRSVVPPVYFTGGVALQPGMCLALREALKSDVRVAPDPQFTGALGAALLAAEQRAV
ncbi:MAG: acyl-CoA dehydratase activase, partial [Verrucomicrobiae bacterium]|nr:acyl-CoA dehydratase activase [Verrucomicrobiae bacterium]